MMLFKHSNISITQSKFHNNVASDSSHSQTHSGTGVMALYEQSTAAIDKCVFLRNGQWDSAFVTANNSAVTIRDSSF